MRKTEITCDFCGSVMLDNLDIVVMYAEGEDEEEYFVGKEGGGADICMGCFKPLLEKYKNLRNLKKQ